MKSWCTRLYKFDPCKIIFNANSDMLKIETRFGLLSDIFNDNVKCLNIICDGHDYSFFDARAPDIHMIVDLEKIEEMSYNYQLEFFEMLPEMTNLKKLYYMKNYMSIWNYCDDNICNDSLEELYITETGHQFDIYAPKLRVLYTSVHDSINLNCDNPQDCYICLYDIEWEWEPKWFK